MKVQWQVMWDKVKDRQAGLRKHRDFHERQRPRMLLSGLLKCACCGGGFSKVSQHHYGCSTARNKGTCENRLTIRQDKLEALIVSDEFAGKSRVQRQQAVNQVLRQLFDSGELHALSMKTQTPEEWSAARG